MSEFIIVYNSHGGDGRPEVPLLQSGLAASALLAYAALSLNAQAVIVNEAGGPLAAFGEGEIRAAAAGKGIGARVVLSIVKDLGNESFRIRRSADGVAVEGGDARGVMYGALDLAEQFTLTGAAQDKSVRPTLAVRALKFNIPLPGTGYLSEEDLANNQWFWDLDYWRQFLDMAARNRYNAITFWSAHPYPRMVLVGKYPESAEVPAAELDRNIAFFRTLFQLAAERGLDTYLVTWNIHVSRAFAQKHGIAASGFDSPLVRDYQRECIKALFATYPMLTGLGATVGERMRGMDVKQKLDWIAGTYFAALKEIGRPIPFILRYWQSEPEPMAAMLDEVKPAGPVYLDIKYNGEHMYSSPKPHVLDKLWMELAGKRYRLLWHLRNDCIFILRWGDPDFVRETVRNMSGPTSAGFVEGSELDVPGPDRIHTPGAKAHLDWRYKFEKHWFRYMLWGRVGYSLDEPEGTWRGHFTGRFGPAGGPAYEATKQAGKIVPAITSYHWNYMNGDWYPEGSIGSWNTSHEQPRTNYRRAAMYHDIRTYVFNNTIDSSLANPVEWVAGSKAPGPLETAAQLEGYGRKALDLIAQARSRVERGRKEFACTEADLQAYGNLGFYYAEKLRGAAYLARFLFHAEEADRAKAITHLERALAACRAVVAATENHYIPHEVWLFGQFDWKRYTADVERDIGIVKAARPYRSTYAEEGLHTWLEYAYDLLGRPKTPPGAGGRVIVEARDAISVTPPMERHGDAIVMAGAAAKAAGESITGARDYISTAASATWRVDIPSDGAWELRVVGSGNYIALVDESQTRLGALGVVLQLGAGPHTVRIFGREPGVRIERLTFAPPLASPASIPDWARPGRIRSARWDGGPIEAEKGRLSDWPHYTAADELGVMAATRGWYHPRTVEFLKTAHINWAWITWSVGFSEKTERIQWEQAQRYIEECHRQGIRIAAYLSIANMFFADMFENVPGSREWVEMLPDGTPRFYKRPNRYMARIDGRPWLDYVKMRVRAALDAGADSFWIDNTFAYHGEENVRRLLDEVYGEAVERGRQVVIMSNYNRNVYRWARLQNGVTTEDGQEPGWYPDDPEPRRLVTNAGLLRYQYAVSEGWRPVSVEYGGRHDGERFTNPMEPAKWQLSLAECAAFQASLEPFFEGLFLRDLYRGEPAAKERLAAIGRYNAFLERYEQYYTSVESAAQIAVLASDDKAVAALNSLAARNVQFDVVFSPPAPGRYRRVLDTGSLPQEIARDADPVAVEAPSTVLYNVVRQRGERRLLLHVLNYAGTPASSLRVRLREPAVSATLLSPDFDGPRELPITGGSFSVPELRIYNLVAISLK